MKTLRVWLLLLLALLLPVRGALAVAMQCSAPSPQAQVQAQLPGGLGHHAAGAGHAHQHEAADHVAGADGSPDAAHDPAAADKCNLCASSCSATALVSASLTVAEPQHVSALLPYLLAPSPSFVPDGQERPPRTT